MRSQNNWGINWLKPCSTPWAPMVEYACRTCNAAWSHGRWAWGCRECGGAAMLMPCEWCGEECGGFFERAPMDSNDSAQSHFFGGCRKPNARELLLTRWPLLEKTLASQADLHPVREALQAFHADDAWERTPSGPPQLQVLRDVFTEAGLAITPRGLAHLVFTREEGP